MTTKVIVTDIGAAEATITVHVNPRTFGDLAEDVAAVAKAIWADEVHVDARGIGAGIADITASKLRGRSQVISHYDPKELPR